MSLEGALAARERGEVPQVTGQEGGVRDILLDAGHPGERKPAFHIGLVGGHRVGAGPPFELQVLAKGFETGFMFFFQSRSSQ